MSLVLKLPQILEKSKSEYEDILNSIGTSNKKFVVKEDYYGKSTGNILGRGDNLRFMEFLLREKGMGGKLDLVYIDPPFFSNADYKSNISLGNKATIKKKAYKDTWENGMEQYLAMLAIRLRLIKELLSETGSIWIHLDWHGVHYAKIILDEIFGEDNFRNEIIWQYKSGGTGKRHFARKHDTLLFYSKTKNYYFRPQKEKSYNRGMKPYRFKGVEEHQDEVGWYTMVNMKDVWQIDMVGRTSGERTGYATQKPEQLLSRILESCTSEGDICADFFGGSGTLAAVAGKMNRRWVSCDKGSLSISGQKKRLLRDRAEFTYYEDNVGIDEEIQGKIKLKVEINEDNIVQFELLSYEATVESQQGLKESHRTDLMKIQEKYSLNLVDFFTVDYNYDGKIHKPEDVFIRNKEEITAKWEKQIGTKVAVSIKIIDVFGNLDHKIIYLGDD